MTAITAAFFAFSLFVSACGAFLLGLQYGRDEERQRIRSRLIADQATCAEDYSEAEEYADKMV